MRGIVTGASSWHQGPETTKPAGGAESRLQATDVANPDLELDLRRIEGRIDVLEEMLREAGH